MVQAFRSEQDIKEAQGSPFRAQTPGNITPVNPFAGVASNIASVFTQLGEDKDRKALGRFMSKAQNHLRKIQNPARFEIRRQELISQGLERFGAVALNPLTSGFSKEVVTRPEIRINVPGNEMTITTGGGQFIKRPLSEVTGNQELKAIADNSALIAGRFQSHLPQTSSALERIGRIADAKAAREGRQPVSRTESNYYGRLATILSTPPSTLEGVRNTIATFKQRFPLLAQREDFYAPLINQALTQHYDAVIQFKNATIERLLSTQSGITVADAKAVTTAYINEFSAKFTKVAIEAGLNIGTVEKLTGEHMKLLDNFENYYTAVRNRSTMESNISRKLLENHIAILKGNALLKVSRDMEATTGMNVFELQSFTEVMKPMAETITLFQSVFDNKNIPYTNIFSEFMKDMLAKSPMFSKGALGQVSSFLDKPLKEDTDFTKFRIFADNFAVTPSMMAINPALAQKFQTYIANNEKALRNKLGDGKVNLWIKNLKDFMGALSDHSKATKQSRDQIFRSADTVRNYMINRFFPKRSSGQFEQEQGRSFVGTPLEGLLDRLVTLKPNLSPEEQKIVDKFGEFMKKKLLTKNPNIGKIPTSPERDIIPRRPQP